jgi:hypothetical protein
MGQRQEYRRGDIYSSPVSIMESDGSRYIPGQMVLASDQANVLGVGYADLDNSGQKNVIAFNHQDYLHIFSSPNRPVWTGEDKLGGSVSRFLLEPDDPTDDLIPQYFPMRLRTADTDQDKKVEVIAAANHDTAQSLVRGFRSFSKSHIQALTWDSLGLRPIWNTRTLPGRISDFFIEDFDNDGIVEIVIAIVAKKNALLSLNSESYIIAYELMPGK